MPPKRMTANPLKPSRHRPGKGADPESSDSDSSADEEATPQETIPPPPKATSAGRIISNLSKANLDSSRQAGADAEQRRLDRAKAERLAAEEGFVTESEEESEGDDDDEEESDEEEEEESSEDEAPRRKLMMRPKFIPKSQRGKDSNKEAEEEAAIAAEEARQKDINDMLEESIKRDIAAKAAGKKHWDDEENESSEVDTTDGLDPEAEQKAWEVRELKRLKRHRAEIEEAEREIAEKERRQNLTEEERHAEDKAHIDKQQEEKDAKNKMAFKQRYLHKGAFMQDEMEAAGLANRDIMGTRIQDDVRNREALPEYLQKRDMTKLGKKGGTKYKDMRSEDTGSWGQYDNGRRGGRERFDGDDRFKPDEDDRFKPDERDANGANKIPLGKRRNTSRERDEGEKRRRVE